MAYRQRICCLPMLTFRCMYHLHNTYLSDSTEVLGPMVMKKGAIERLCWYCGGGVLDEDES